MSDPVILPCGESALLIELPDLPAVWSLDRVVAQARSTCMPPWAAVRDAVPGARTLLVVVEPGADRPALVAALSELARRVVVEGADGGDAAGAEDDAEPVCIPVRYDGPDLAAVAEATGLTEQEVVAAHTGTPWRVGFGGFAPGFAYLVDGDPRLQVPRRAEPRTRVPAGAVGLAGAYSGIYPRESPGGWQLLGTTDVVLWDPQRDPPALLRPGGRVRFQAELDAREPEPARSRLALPSSLAPSSLDSSVQREPRAWALEVLQTGPLTLVEDLGRPGWGAVGVSPSGAADRAAYRLGARLVGNPDGLAALEITLGGLSVRAHGTLTICLTGAPAPATIDDRPVGHAALLTLAGGQILRLGTPPTGLRSYLTVRGGIDVEPILGSRSTDLLSGLGPPPLRPGDHLPVGVPPVDFPRLAQVPVPRPSADLVELAAHPGPRRDWLADPNALTAATWQVSDRSDRVGLRLDGPLLQRDVAHRHTELPSEGLVRGGIQLPPNGQPVVFLADHPVTGGYPVVAVLTTAAADLAAQCRPGQRLRLRWSA